MCMIEQDLSYVCLFFSGDFCRLFQHRDVLLSISSTDTHASRSSHGSEIVLMECHDKQFTMLSHLRMIALNVIAILVNCRHPTAWTSHGECTIVSGCVAAAAAAAAHVHRHYM